MTSKINSWLIAGIMLLSASFLFAADPTPATNTDAAPDKAITGEMIMVFNTRTSTGFQEGAVVKGAKDVYSTRLVINGNRGIVGDITRQPRLKQWGVRVAQQGQLDFNLRWQAYKGGNINDAATMGNWTGVMSANPDSGQFAMDGGGDTERALRVMVDLGPTIKENFGGTFYGKPADKSSLTPSAFKRWVNGKEIEYKYTPDPIRFENLLMAEGPDKGRYPRCTVNGSLDYDRSTGNYFAQNLTMSYEYMGKQITDKVSGSIKWIEDPQRQQNGKGRYEFNLRFNEDKNFKPAPEDNPGKINDDDAIFAVIKGQPGLTGYIDYVDSFTGSQVKDPDGKPMPVSSKATYNIQANSLSKQQVMNFAKMWLIVTGPTQDE